MAPSFKRAFKNMARGFVDGLATAMGVMVGTEGTNAPAFVIKATVAAGVANAIAAAASAFVGETAEIHRRLHEIKKDHDGKPGEEHRKIVEFLKSELLIEEEELHNRGIMDGLSTFLGSLIPIIPLFVLPYPFSITFAIITCIGLMTALGAYIGHLSKEHVFKLAAKVFVVGIIVLVASL